VEFETSEKKIEALGRASLPSGKRIERAERGEHGEFDRMSDDELRCRYKQKLSDDFGRLLGCLLSGAKPTCRLLRRLVENDQLRFLHRLTVLSLILSISAIDDTATNDNAHQSYHYEGTQQS
jgi:hypothetical protein